MRNITPIVRKRNRIYFRLVWTFLSLVLTFIYLKTNHHPPPVHSTLKRRGEVKAATNFQPLLNQSIKDKALANALIVNSTLCKIPNLDPWGESVKLLHKWCSHMEDETDPKCGETDQSYSWNWMSANATHLIINDTDLGKLGLFWESMHCCYMTIDRVEQTLKNYTYMADSVIKYSSCRRLRRLETPIHFEFIRVNCVTRGKKTVSEGHRFFAFPQRNNQAEKKIKLLTKKLNNTSAPNVVVLVIDNNSRLNFRRTLNKTLEVLRNAGAHELMGYTKVGYNSYPNTVAFLTGMKESTMTSKCRKTRWIAQDKCPYVWQDFSRAGYLTITAEDQPYFGTFNYLKTGFVQKPTDFYFRPMSLAWMEDLPEDQFFLKCIGPYQSDEFLLNYLIGILDLAWGKAPVFIHIQLTVFSHDCLDSTVYNDAAVSRFVETLMNKYPNTILFLMGDHGDRRGAFRQSLMGWYEDKLPAMWIHVPPSIQKTFPEWRQALNVNSARLTFHFDLYHTLLHILETFDLLTKSQVKHAHATKMTGQSLFSEVPENRTCADAGIADSYCPCVAPRILNLTSIGSKERHRVKEASKAAMSFLGKVLSKQCAKLKVREIISAWEKKLQNRLGYIIHFYADPGNFLFEATVDLRNFTRGRPVFHVKSLDNILRLNSIDKGTECISDYVYETYCYCK